MTQHDHQHGHQHGHDHHHGHNKKRPIHKDWRAWTVVLLMLAAMAAYVLSMDESIQPGRPQGEAMPAATGP